MADAHKNFAISTVATAPSPATTGTTLVVATGHGTRFPTAPFNATICPANTTPDPTNAEIVRVTDVTGDTLTIDREEESTSARTVVVGDLIFAAITAKSLEDIETAFADHSARHENGGADEISVAGLSGELADRQPVKLHASTHGAAGDDAITITPTQAGLSNVTNDAQTKAAIVPNTAPSSGQILVGNVGGTAYAPVSMSGQATIDSTGAVTIAAGAVTYAKMQDVSATDKVLGRSTAGSGDVEEISCTAAGRNLIGDATVLAQQQRLNPLTINAQTDSYTLVLADAGKLVQMNKATANTLTVPKNSSVAFPTGTTILCGQIGAGLTTVSPVDGDVTINSRGAALKSGGQYAQWSFVKTATDTWVMSGDITA